MKRSTYKKFKRGPMTAYKIGLAPLIGRIVLLLTTTGRKSGLPRTTPLQYEYIEGCYIVSSVFGTKADWVKNLAANPQAQVRVKNKRFAARAEISTDVEEITQMIEYRIKKHPRMIRAIMRMDGFGADFTREDLLAYSANLALVKLIPEEPFAS